MYILVLKSPKIFCVNKTIKYFTHRSYSYFILLIYFEDLRTRIYIENLQQYIYELYMNIYEEINEIPDDPPNEIHINQYIFLLGCEAGNIDLIEWVLFCDSIDETLEDNLPFILACENNHLDVAKYLHARNPQMEFSDLLFIKNMFVYQQYDLLKWIHHTIPSVFDTLTSTELYDFFELAVYSDLEMAFWMGKCFPQLRVYSNNNKLFIDACNSNDIDVAQLVVSIRPHCYYLCVIDNKIIHYDICSILQICCSRDIIAETCYICYENTSNVVTSCNHQYCLDCIEKHYSVNNHLCPYCRTENWENDLAFIEKV